MLPPHVPPPYRIVLNNDEEATVLAGDRLLARFHGGGRDYQGHANARFFAKAAEAHQALVLAAGAAQDFLAGISPKSHERDVRDQLESALRVATSEPQITHWSDLVSRRTQLREMLADLLDRPTSQLPSITEEQDRLLGELELVELLLGH